VLRSFRWIDGHADVWRLFADADVFRIVTAALADPWAGDEITRVCGVESRGFLLGGAVALRLGAGFVAVRKGDGLFPGAKVERTTAPDYRGRAHCLRLRRDALGPDDRVVLVDDWAERGSQAIAVRDAVEECGATFLGTTLIVDQLDDATRRKLGRVVSIVRAEELGDSSL